jgi:hypothetical protein
MYLFIVLHKKGSYKLAQHLRVIVKSFYSYRDLNKDTYNDEFAGTQNRAYYQALKCIKIFQKHPLFTSVRKNPLNPTKMDAIYMSTQKKTSELNELIIHSSPP